eukprot:gene19167-biopygen6962
MRQNAREGSEEYAVPEAPDFGNNDHTCRGCDFRVLPQHSRNLLNTTGWLVHNPRIKKSSPPAGRTTGALKARARAGRGPGAGSVVSPLPGRTASDGEAVR